MNKLLIALFATIVSVTSFAKGGEPLPTITDSKKDVVEVLYFHGKQRCITCKSIEKHTKDVLTAYFADQVKNGKIVFRVIDISEPANEKIAEKYEVTWSSLFINKWKGGKEKVNNMTEFGFSYAKSSPEVFKAGVKKKIEELLK
ncbi:MAG: nitrophenyl compound nitroreductase subunit ArsF family protein [Porphyromonadaceae bacterium]|nr:nitrophenyl compound nitroreductase subunit ArsF family protein [Porphyromonadaceae bacterium]